MRHTLNSTKLSFWMLLMMAGAVWAGPPFVVDDPEPLDYQHGEIFLTSQIGRSSGTTSGFLPDFEINYGVLPDLQLHLLVPLAFSAEDHGGSQFGYGDTELGVKYRFFHGTDLLPDIGTFPLLELPTGDQARGFGSGHTDAFLPIWMYKSFGKWNASGGGGYWINPGAGNRNWWFFGGLLQRKVTSNLTLGVEVFHETAQDVGGRSDTKFNAGGVWDLSDTYHVMLAAGHTIQGPSSFIGTVAFQITFGPKTPEKSAAK